MLMSERYFGWGNYGGLGGVVRYFWAVLIWTRKHACMLHNYELNAQGRLWECRNQQKESTDEKNNDGKRQENVNSNAQQTGFKDYFLTPRASSHRYTDWPCTPQRTDRWAAEAVNMTAGTLKLRLVPIFSLIRLLLFGFLSGFFYGKMIPKSDPLKKEIRLEMTVCNSSRRLCTCVHSLSDKLQPVLLEANHLGS